MKSELTINETIYSSPFILCQHQNPTANGLAELGAMILLLLELKKNGKIFKEKVHLICKFFHNSEEVINATLSNKSLFTVTSEGDYLANSKEIFNVFNSKEFTLSRKKMSHGGKKGMSKRYQGKKLTDTPSEKSENKTLEIPYDNLRDTLDIPYKVLIRSTEEEPVTDSKSMVIEGCVSSLGEIAFAKEGSVEEEKDYIYNNTNNNIYSNKEYNKHYNTIKVKDNKESKKTRNTQRFITPTIEELKSYIAEINSGVSAEAFYDYYESVNWQVGAKKMSNWKAAVRTWERKNKNQPTLNFNGKSQPASYNSSSRVGSTKDKNYDLPF